MNAIVSLGDIERMAHAVSKSNLFGVKTPEQAIALMLVAQAEGGEAVLSGGGHLDFDVCSDIDVGVGVVFHVHSYFQKTVTLHPTA